MSRVGKKAIPIPDQVEITITPAEITVKGKKGILTEKRMGGIDIKKDEKEVTLIRASESRENRAAHGLMRSLIANMLKGVTEGFEKKLNIVGVGYKAELKGKSVNLALGFSHPIEFPLPEGVSAAYDKNGNSLTISGADGKLVGEVAACIRRFRPPEPYKGKGVMYAEETIRRKVGKSAGGK